jgi:Rrf2 family protein
VLTKTAEYALRAVIHLAQHRDEWPIPGNQVAERAGIPAKYLSKVLGDLVRAGVLTSSRGKRGGFGMVRSPGKTHLSEILAPFEQCEIRRCPFGNTECSDSKPCLAHDRWKKVVAAEREFFRKTSIYDVSIQRRKSRRKKK